MRKELTLENLKDLDFGKAAKIWEQKLSGIITDCFERPNESGPRELSLVAKIKPETDQAGDCSDVKVEFHVKTRLPSEHTKQYSMGVTKHGHVFFAEDSSDNPDQLSFDDVDPSTGRPREIG